MLRVQLVVPLALLSIVVVTTGSSILGMPECTGSVEYCQDRDMHPDLPTPPAGYVKSASTAEKSNEYWLERGAAHVASKLSQPLNKKRAKNVIMFLGDGMGLPTVAATRLLLGGEEQQLSFEHFPYVGMAKTYSVDIIVPDSACTATAYLCGVKAQVGTIGVNGAVPRTDCVAMLDERTHVNSIAKWAMDAGKWAGVVTTTRITHASPAGVYAHIADRQWEDDTELAKDCGKESGVQDIAYQLMRGEVGSKLKVIMGGGRKHFVSANLSAEGHRSDGLDLIAEYKRQSAKNVYVQTRDELQQVKVNEADRLLGLFQADHLLFHLETNETTNQPTLEEMTRKAIEYLSQNDEGYFVFIEGGRIDLAHHKNRARLALDETVEFSKAIAAARELTNEEDTLIVATADHSHVFSYSGYGYRGNDIFGAAPAKANDGKPYMILNYANGPSYPMFYDAVKMERVNPTTVITGNTHDAFPSGVPLVDDTHGGDDVPVYANGPWSHLFTGIYEQNAIPHFMAYAACLGDGLKMCDATETAANERTTV